ncbi:hypothetical protein B0T24DRAFT_344841 [Lasiosphaeria ovina]|uniref:Uncharacterized protein n=1 Tax=Lasiosphaeria ovina TaxID=92902 RepID=A0AAE0K3I4_9PEZI|nr:hypothetical protein B0T24DRAFT_344841 [Lasiosphaeria ovina]
MGQGGLPFIASVRLSRVLPLLLLLVAAAAAAAAATVASAAAGFSRSRYSVFRTDVAAAATAMHESASQMAAGKRCGICAREPEQTMRGERGPERDLKDAEPDRPLARSLVRQAFKRAWPGSKKSSKAKQPRPTAGNKKRKATRVPRARRCSEFSFAAAAAAGWLTDKIVDRQDLTQGRAWRQQCMRCGSRSFWPPPELGMRDNNSQATQERNEEVRRKRQTRRPRPRQPAATYLPPSPSEGTSPSPGQPPRIPREGCWPLPQIKQQASTHAHNARTQRTQRTHARTHTTQ